MQCQYTASVLTLRVYWMSFASISCTGNKAVGVCAVGKQIYVKLLYKRGDNIHIFRPLVCILDSSESTLSDPSSKKIQILENIFSALHLVSLFSNWPKCPV